MSAIVLPLHCAAADLYRCKDAQRNVIRQVDGDVDVDFLGKLAALCYPDSRPRRFAPVKEFAYKLKQLLATLAIVPLHSSVGPMDGD